MLMSGTSRTERSEPERSGDSQPKAARRASNARQLRRLFPCTEAKHSACRELCSRILKYIDVEEADQDRKKSYPNIARQIVHMLDALALFFIYLA
jgi:hypothetical protein